METVLLAIIIFLPAGFANASPVFVNKIPWLNRWRTPLDLGKSYQGKRVFGDNKTWRGLAFGTLVGALTSWAIHAIWYTHPAANELWLAIGRIMRFGSGDYIILGGLMGFGALAGDAIESFFKRQRGVRSGDSWFPFDQLDYILGAFLFMSPLVYFTLRGYLIITVVWMGIHLLASYIGYLVGLKSKPI